MQCTKCSTIVRPVAAFDLDGSLGDYHGGLFDFAEEWLGTEPGFAHHLRCTYDGSMKIARAMGITDEVYRQMKLAYRQGGGKRMMDPFEGALDLVRCAYSAGMEVWITTTRPYNRFDSTDPDTRHWLERHGFPWHHIIYDDDKYHRLAEQVDVDRIVMVFEDQEDQLSQAGGLKMPTCLMRTTYNSGLLPWIREAVSCRHAQQILVKTLEEWKEANA